jgi:hypothetical protein
MTIKSGQADPFVGKSKGTKAILGWFIFLSDKDRRSFFAKRKNFQYF